MSESRAPAEGIDSSSRDPNHIERAYEISLYKGPSYPVNHEKCPNLCKRSVLERSKSVAELASITTSGLSDAGLALSLRFHATGSSYRE